jgi:hypothetical protein
MKSVLIFLVVVGLALAHHEKVSSHQQDKVKKLYDSVVTPDYFPAVRPYGVNGTDATYVTVHLRDINVLNVIKEKGVFTFTSYIRKEWVDPRLAYNDTSVSYIPVRDCKKLWYPDVFFQNGVQVEEYPFPDYHVVPRTARIYPNGRVFSSAYFPQSVHCPAIFKTDVKEFTCALKVGSYGYFNDELVVMLGDVNAVKDVYIPGFTFGGVTTVPCDNVKTKARIDEDETHFHSCVQVNFKFTRV